MKKVAVTGALLAVVASGVDARTAWPTIPEPGARTKHRSHDERHVMRKRVVAAISPDPSREEEP